MKRQRWLAAAAWLSTLALAAHAGAEDSSPRPRPVALFKTATADSRHAPLAAALDPVLQAELANVSAVEVASQPALDLPSMQLALDCVGETPSCLTLVAERSHVVGLLAPTVTRTGDAVVLSLLWYDPDRQPAMQLVTQQVPVSAGDDAVLARVPVLVRALFGIPEPLAPAPVAAEAPVPAQPDVVQTPPAAAAPAASEASKKPSLLLPIVLGAAGVAVIATGIAFGAAANGTESAYARTRVADERDATRAQELYDSASSYALVSNVAFGVGAAALLAGAVLFSWNSFGPPSTERPRQARTRIGVGLAQITLAGTWN